MTERFGDAALRHLATADLLRDEGRNDDAAYHYGLVGETALKEAVVRATGRPLPTTLRRHINDPRRSLQDAIMRDTAILSLLASGRLGGAVGWDLSRRHLARRFAGWSLAIRYADDACCPVADGDLAAWSDDARALYNNGVF